VLGTGAPLSWSEPGHPDSPPDARLRHGHRGRGSWWWASSCPCRWCRRRCPRRCTRATPTGTDPARGSWRFVAVAAGILLALLSATGQADPDRRLPICALEWERLR